MAADGPASRISSPACNRVSGRELNILASAQNALDDDAPADLFLDLSYGLTGGRRNLVRPCLEFPVQKIAGLRYSAAR